VWKLQVRQRDLDSNIICLQPGTSIDAHAGPDLDALLIVLDGAGQLITELNALELRPGALAWLPRRSRRQFTAGPYGLSYVTIHRRRQSLVLDETRKA
jgi:quercetin dioxygenase-like cupin family protein